MTDKLLKTIKLGDRVRILSPGGLTGRVIELRGPLGPNGAQIYRIRLPRKPKPSFVEVREDQIEVIDTDTELLPS